MKKRILRDRKQPKAEIKEEKKVVKRTVKKPTKEEE